MTIIKKHTETVSWAGNLGGYSWQPTAISFTPPSGFTLTKVESVANYHTTGSAGYVYLGWVNSNTPYIYITSSTPTTYTWSQPFEPSTIPQYANTSGGSATFAITSITWYYTKTFPNVTAGNDILATDFTNVGLSATQGNNISNSNFTTGANITASEWNSKTITLTF